MHESAKKLFSLMFRPGETVCVSHNKFGYHSIPLENASVSPVVLVPTEDSLAKRRMSLEQGIERIDSSSLTLVALNPIKGYREDANCTSYRNFLIEMDYGPLPEQMAYAKKLGLPYSAVVFSGNKSLHFLVSLDKDLPSESVYRKFSEWILGVVTAADQKTKNPSRQIRIPGAYREPGKKQILVDFKGATKVEDLVNWLKLHPDAEPKEVIKKVPSGTRDLSLLPGWVADKLVNGMDPRKGRNQQWFGIAYEFCLAGFSEDDTMDILQEFFAPDRDFKHKEWKTCIRSAFKHVERNVDVQET